MYYFSVFFIISTVALVFAKDAKSEGVSKWFRSIEGFISKNNFSYLLNNVKSLFGEVTNGDNNLIETKTEDILWNSKDLISKNGYDLEEHHVQTEDGYILTLHKIRQEENRTTKNVDVFLMHGILDSSDCWVLQGPNKSLAFILADEGYNVWMGNARGNKYSNTHVNLTTADTQYWKFSWEEIGLYDLPAMIDYILKYTQRDSLYYIGHSQGTTSFFVMASMQSEYNSKIKMMFSLSPVSFMGHVKSPIVRMFSPANKLFSYWLSNFNTFSSSTDFFNKIFSAICFFVPKCDNILYLIVGNDNKFINETLLPVIFAHMPSGSSTMQFLHYGQLVESRRFCRYDFGVKVNTQIYTSVRPPGYELQLIIAPVVVYYSNNDWLSDAADVKLLISKLPNTVDSYIIDEYNHWDYLYATNAKDMIYRNITEKINGHERYLFEEE